VKLDELYQKLGELIKEGHGGKKVDIMLLADDLRLEIEEIKHGIIFVDGFTY